MTLYLWIIEIALTFPILTKKKNTAGKLKKKNSPRKHIDFCEQNSCIFNILRYI